MSDVWAASSAEMCHGCEKWSWWSEPDKKEKGKRIILTCELLNLTVLHSMYLYGLHLCKLVSWYLPYYGTVTVWWQYSFFVK